MLRNVMSTLLCRMPRLYNALERRRSHSSIEKRVFLSLLRSGDVVLDVGANQGHYTVLFSNLVGRPGEVHAFEPVPPTFAMLKERVHRQAWYQNVRFNNVALSESHGVARMHLPGGDDGQASLARHETGSWSNHADVKTFDCTLLTLDEYRRTLSRPIDFIKVDVEGAELLIVKGGAETLQTQSPALFLEVQDEWCKDFDYTPAILWNALTSAGYEDFFAVTDKVTPVHSAPELPASGNLLAFKRNSGLRARFSTPV